MTKKSPPYFDAQICDLDQFKTLTSKTLSSCDVPHACKIEKNVPIYDMAQLRPALDDEKKRRALMAEWAFVLRYSAGVIALECAYEDTSVIDRATDVFNEIIRQEREEGGAQGDHFAAVGANDRVWNALQKHCLFDPKNFVEYYANTAIAAVCEAWLGPHYQMTAQVNQVRPGGKAQQPHCDYHLGFQAAEVAAKFPVHTHELTAALTLQGAVVHIDMSIESGPTKLLPFSQSYEAGYLAFHNPDFAAYFEEKFVQLPLQKGDAIFFNPALFHAGGSNKSADILRMVNLLQISSAFGRAMEAVDRNTMVCTSYDALRQAKSSLSMAQIHAAIAAIAEGYSFPTNLDTDPPIGGNAPETQADILRIAVAEDWSQSALKTALDKRIHRQKA